MLKEDELAAVFPESSAVVESRGDCLQQAQDEYAALQESDLLRRGRRLRDGAIAHILIRDEPTPDVTYETLYGLHDAIESLVTRLYYVCCRGKPQFLEYQERLNECAKAFWDTYFAGMRS